jgi:hypothetical protein
MGTTVHGRPKPEPWNERAVRCVLEHAIPVLGSYPGHATDKLVLLNMARHAHPGGCGVTVGKYTQSKQLGCSDRTVWDSVRRLYGAGWLERTAQRTGKRGSDTYRVMLCQRCRANTARRPCQRCSPPTAASTPPAPPAVSSRHPNSREGQVESAGTPTTTPRSRPPAASANGQRPSHVAPVGNVIPLRAVAK